MVINYIAKHMLSCNKIFNTTLMKFLANPSCAPMLQSPFPLSMQPSKEHATKTSSRPSLTPPMPRIQLNSRCHIKTFTPNPQSIQPCHNKFDEHAAEPVVHETEASSPHPSYPLARHNQPAQSLAHAELSLLSMHAAEYCA
jgi:hypothetical protein